MDLLAYWRFDNYKRDLDEGAGFHFNSNQSRLHSAIGLGESLWLFTRVPIGAENQYRLLARLVVSAKTINAPDYKYGAYRVWGDLAHSDYYSVREDSQDDVFDLIRELELEGTGLGDSSRTSLAQACQTIRAIKPSASVLLSAKAQQLPIETRARFIPEEESLERTLSEGSDGALGALLEKQGAGYGDAARANLRHTRERNRELVVELNELYGGRCQVTGHDSPILYGVPTAEAHHIVYRSRGGDDTLGNLVLLSPNVHRAVHAASAQFDYSKLAFVFPNNRVEPLVMNRHLEKRAA